MTNSLENTANEPPKVSDKELNFRALEAKYQRELEKVNSERERLQQQLQQRFQQDQSSQKEEDYSDEPYIDEKRFNRKMSDFEKKLEEKIDKKAEEKARHVIQNQKKEEWLNQNPDFYDVLQQHAERFATKAPKLAESILRMPDNFERQQLVYNNIKAMGIDQPEPKSNSIQNQIDANKRSPYYQPSGVGTAPYSQTGDFSSSGQKNAYTRMKELQSRLRM